MTSLERLQRAQQGMTAAFDAGHLLPKLSALGYAVSALLQWAIDREERDEAPTLIPPDPKAWERRDPFSEAATRETMPTLSELSPQPQLETWKGQR